MNIPTYQKKDYSYLQNAFTGLQQGANQFQQGLTQTMNIGEREDKRARAKELLGQIKLSNKEAQKVREVAITELATDILDVMGAGDSPEAIDYARSRASQYYHPFTAKELQEGSGIGRLWTQEQDREKLLNKFRMKRVNEKLKGGMQTEQFTPTKTIQEPVGTVGVEDTGEVKKPLETAPSQQEMQESAGRVLETQPTFIKSLPRKITADDLLREFPELVGDKKFQSILDYVGRQDIAGRDWPEGTTQEEVMREYTQTPVPSEAGYKYVGAFPKKAGEDDYEALKLKKIKQEIELLEKKGVSGDIKETNKQIQKLIDRGDEIAKLKLSNTLKLNRYKLAIQKLKQGQPLSEQIRAGLGNVSANPDIEELERGADYIQMQTDDLDVTAERNQFLIDRLSKGGSVGDAQNALNKRDQETFREAVGWLQVHIPLSKKGDRSIPKYRNLYLLLKNMPAKYRPIVSKKAKYWFDMGVSNSEFIDWMYGKRKEKQSE